MALIDINFQEGEGMDYLIEIPIGDLNSPIDILIEDSGQFLLMEIPSQAGGGGNIFIMSE